MSTNVNKNIVKKTVVAQNNSSNKQTAAQSTNATAKKASTMTVASIIDNLKTGKTSVAQATVDLRNLGASVTSKKVGNKTTLTIKSAGKSYVVTTNSVKISKVVMQPTKTVESIVNDLKLGKITVAAATKDLKALGATVSTRKSAAKTVVTVKDSKGKSFSVTTNSNMANAHVTTKVDDQPKITDDPICPGVPTEDLQNEMANVENIVKNFIEGKIKIATAKSFLMQNGATDIKQTDSNGYTTISFTHRGKSYSMTCSQVAAQDSATNFVELEGKISLTGDAKTTKTSYTEQELKNTCTYPEIIDKYFYVALKEDGEIKAYALKDGFTYEHFVQEAVTTKLTRQDNAKNAHLEMLEELFKEIENNPNEQLLLQLSCHYGVNITSTEGLSDSVIKSLKSQFIDIDEIKNILTNMVNSSNLEEPLNIEELLTTCFARFRSSNVQLHYQVNKSADQILSSTKFQNYLKENGLDTSDMDVYKEALFALVSRFEEGSSCPSVDKLTDMLITFMDQNGLEALKELNSELFKILNDSLSSYIFNLKPGDVINIAGLRESLIADLSKNYKEEGYSEEDALQLAKENAVKFLSLDNIDNSLLVNEFVDAMSRLLGVDDKVELLKVLLNEGIYIGNDEESSSKKNIKGKQSAASNYTYLTTYEQIKNVYPNGVIVQGKPTNKEAILDYYQQTYANPTNSTIAIKILAGMTPVIAQVDAILDVAAHITKAITDPTGYAKDWSVGHWGWLSDNPELALAVGLLENVALNLLQFFGGGAVSKSLKLTGKAASLLTVLLGDLSEVFAKIAGKLGGAKLPKNIQKFLEVILKIIGNVSSDDYDAILSKISSYFQSQKTGHNEPDSGVNEPDSGITDNQDSSEGYSSITLEDTSDETINFKFVDKNGNTTNVQFGSNWVETTYHSILYPVIGNSYIYEDPLTGNFYTLSIGPDGDGNIIGELNKYTDNGSEVHRFRVDENGQIRGNGISGEVDPETGDIKSITIVTDNGDKATVSREGLKIERADGTVEQYAPNGELISITAADGTVVYSSKNDSNKQAHAEADKYKSDTQSWWSSGYSNSVGFGRFQNHLDNYDDYVSNGGSMSFDEWHSSTYGNSESDALSRYWQYIASGGGAGGGKFGIKDNLEQVQDIRKDYPIYQAGSIKGTVAALKAMVENELGYDLYLDDIVTEAVTRFFNAGYTADDLLTIKSKTNKDEALYGDFIRVCKEIKSRNEILEDCGWNRAITIGKISGNTHFAIIPDGNGGYKYDVRDVQPINVQPKFDSSATQKLDFQKEAFLAEGETRFKNTNQTETKDDLDPESQKEHNEQNTSGDDDSNPFDWYKHGMTYFEPHP